MNLDQLRTLSLRRNHLSAIISQINIFEERASSTEARSKVLNKLAQKEKNHTVSEHLDMNSHMHSHSYNFDDDVEAEKGISIIPTGMMYTSALIHDDQLERCTYWFSVFIFSYGILPIFMLQLQGSQETIYQSYTKHACQRENTESDKAKFVITGANDLTDPKADEEDGAKDEDAGLDMLYSWVYCSSAGFICIMDSSVPSGSNATWLRLDAYAQVGSQAVHDGLLDVDAPRVLVTCRSRQMVLVGNQNENVPLYYHIVNDLQIQFGREEFCLVTGLMFGVEYWNDYDNDEEPIPFRRRVFPSSLDGEHITGKIVEKLIDSKSFDRLHDDDDVRLYCVGILQLVFLGVECRRVAPDWILRLANDRVGWDKYPWGSYVWPTLYSQLKNANVRRPYMRVNLQIKLIKKTYSIFGFTWAFKTWILESFRVTATTYYNRHSRYLRAAAWSKKGKWFLRRMVVDFFHRNLPIARLTPDEIEARSEWWVFSKAYFDGVIDQAERVPRFLNRQNMFEVPSDFYLDFEQQKRDLEQQKRDLEQQKKDFDDMRKKDAAREKMFEQMRTFMKGMNVGPVREANTGPMIVNQYYGMSDFSEFQSNQGGRSSFQTPTNNSFWNTGTPTNWQTPMPSQLGPSNWQSQMAVQSATPFMQPVILSHPGTYNWQSQILSHMGNLKSQTPIETHPDAAGLLDQNIPNRGKREHRPSYFRRTPYVEQAPTTVLPKQRAAGHHRRLPPPPPENFSGEPSDHDQNQKVFLPPDLLDPLCYSPPPSNSPPPRLSQSHINTTTSTSSSLPPSHSNTITPLPS
nr:phospholipase-like protein [Tanacetum cinerariifolium]